MLLEDPQQSDRSLCVVRMTKVGVLSIQPWKLLSEFETRNDWHTANLWLPDLPTWKTTCKGKCSSYMVYKTECSSCNTHACRSCTTMASFTSVPHATHMQIMYYDGQFNDSRMNVALACSSAAAGATVMNYTECKQLIKVCAIGCVQGFDMCVNTSVLRLLGFLLCRRQAAHPSIRACEIVRACNMPV
eukprot:scaffold231466_cov21-Tisochrysis_lutea.AAC.2